MIRISAFSVFRISVFHASGLRVKPAFDLAELVEYKVYSRF